MCLQCSLLVLGMQKEKKLLLGSRYYQLIKPVTRLLRHLRVA
jgi:hypothetical protein